VPYPTTDNSFDIYRAGGTTLDVSTLVQLVLVVRGFRSRLDERLRAINQSSARMETLAAIVNMQGQVSQSDLARRLRVEGATITRMVDLLSADGLVERSPHPTDRRINLLRVTEAGEEALRRIFRVYDLTRGDLLKGIPEEDIAQLHRITGLMLDRLDSFGSSETRAGQIPGSEIKIEDLPSIDRLRDPTAGGSGA